MEFSGLASVQAHRQRAMEYALKAVQERLSITLADADIDTRSPIEAIFALWWEALTIEGVWRIRELNLHPQHETPANGRVYTIDFAVIPVDVESWAEGHELGIPYQQIGIEVDGHDFHERTKEQVTWRNQRDRDLQQAKWRILHFSGSELYQDPARVVDEAAKAGTESLNAFWNQLRPRKRQRGDYGH